MEYYYCAYTHWKIYILYVRTTYNAHLQNENSTSYNVETSCYPKIFGKLENFYVMVCAKKYQIWPIRIQTILLKKPKIKSGIHRSRTIRLPNPNYIIYSFPKHLEDLVRWQYCRITVRRWTGGLELSKKKKNRKENSFLLYNLSATMEGVLSCANLW